MNDRIFRLVAAGFLVLCWSNGLWAKVDSQAAVSGRITNHPDPSFWVTLKPVEKNPLAIYDGYTVPVAADGTFHFKDIDPGKYLLIAQGGGFVPLQYGSPIELSAGQHRAGIALTLVKKHIVCGRVTDENGAPVAKAEVYAYLHQPGRPWLTFRDREIMTATTDSGGNYRLPDLSPGEYFIQVNPYTWYSKSTTLTQIEAENFNNAEPVEVGPDQSSQCRENIRTQPRTGYHGWHMQGKIANYAAVAGKGLVLSVVETNRSGAERWYQSGFAEKADPEESFDLPAIPNGHYRLVLSRGRFPQNWDQARPPQYYELASQEITISDTNVEGITLQPVPLASLDGHIELDGITRSAACPTSEKLHVSMEREDGQRHEVEIGDDRKFSFPQVPVGTYAIRVFPILHTAAYLKSVELDGHTVEGRKLEITSSGPHSLKVAISGDRNNAAGRLSASEPWERFAEAWAHPKASVSGKVTNISAGNGLRVKLWAVRFNSDRSYEYSAQPAADGSFHFDNVDPGIYILLTQGAGYAISEYGAPRPGFEGHAITLKAGQHLDKLSLTAWPKKPSLCGKVIDENRQPVADASVFAWDLTQPAGATASANTSSDKDGGFHLLNLEPGRYSIWAAPRVIISDKSLAQRGTSFVSPPNLDGDQQVDIAYDRNLECKYNIRVRSSPTFHIRGKLPDLPHGPDEVFDLTLLAAHGDRVMYWAQSKPELEPGSGFDFANVLPGRYLLQLTGPRKPSRGLSVSSGPLCGFQSIHPLLTSQKVVVAAGDLNDLAIDLTSVASVTGSVHFEDVPKEWTFFKPDSQNLTLAVENSFCPQSVQLDPHGAFSFHGMEEGTYRVDLGLRAPLYVKAVMLNGRPLEDKHISLVPGEPMRLDVVVSGKGGEVDAVIVPSGIPVEEYRFDEPCGPKITVGPYVLLIPDHIPEDGSGVLRVERTQEGDYEIGGVTPGRYHAVAGENFNLFSALSLYGNSVRWKDPQFLQAVAALGKPVEVAEGQKVKVSLQNRTSEIQNISAEQNHPVVMQDHCVGSCSYEGFWNGSERAEAQH